MSPIAPNLDDRRFQDLVDEAKLRLADRCPEWTDHNVSDPGVMLIELVAAMVDQLIFRLNQVPDRLYVKFLELIGVRPFGARAAAVDVTFWLSAPQPRTIRIERGTQVATPRTPTDEAVVFTVVNARNIPPCAVARVTTVRQSGLAEDRTDTARAGEPFAVFGDPPAVGDAFELDLDAEVAGCAVRLQFQCDPAYGKGIDPERPPLAWEARLDGRWEPCDVTDGTGGLNRSGDVVAHVPPHAQEDPDRSEPTRLRCRVTGAADRPAYDAPPRLSGVQAATVGATTRAEHGELHEAEELGVSDGHAAQRFTLDASPVVEPEDGLVVESRLADEPQVWTRVPDFARSGPHDRHFTLDEQSGEIAFGPALRDADTDRPRQCGGIPSAGARLVVRSYLAGGGERGNVARAAISVLKTTVPFISRVENRAAATGGARAESIDEVKLRGPIELRSLARAVTAEDYEHFARSAAPGIARVRCQPIDAEGLARVLLIPRFEDTPDQPVPLERLVPPARTLARVRRELDRRRVIGARFSVGPARFVGVRVDAIVRVLPGWDPMDTERRAIRALHAYFHPISGGPEGNGWPFGRTVYSGMAHTVLQRVPGVDLVQELALYEVDAATGQPTGDDVQRLALDPDMVVVSRGHKVAAAREDT